MTISRRALLKGFAATAAGLLIPEHVAAEPERRIWALDSTMLHSPRDVVIRDAGNAISMTWDPDFWLDDTLRISLYSTDGTKVAERIVTRDEKDAFQYAFDEDFGIKPFANYIYEVTVWHHE